MGNSLLGALVEVDYSIAVVGSGPAGMSAAARAARQQQSHVLLERMPHLTNTIFNYQKRKHVMAVPPILPLRSDLRFEAGAREEVLDAWSEDMAEARVNVRFNAEVRSVTGSRGGFTIALADGTQLTAAHVILASGTHGHPRHLTIPGANNTLVQYHLNDAADIAGERIVVVGAGDSAIEDALALMERNEVAVVNRGAEFPKAKPANVARIRAAILGGGVTVYRHATPLRIESGEMVLATAEGEARVACDRVIARLGTSPPGEFFRSCGLSAQGVGFPALSETYESQIPGLYVIGSLAGYPLIKHGLKQGYEVVEHILGNHVPPADEPIIAERLRQAAVFATVPEFVASLRSRIELFAPLPPRLLREFLLHATIRSLRPGETIFRRGDYSEPIYWVLDGAVALETAEERVLCCNGDVLGVLEFASGRPRHATATAVGRAHVIEADRAAMELLFRAAPALEHALDRVALTRQMQLQFAPGLCDAEIAELVRSARIEHFKRGEALVAEGGADDPLYFIRKGSVSVSRRADGQEAILAFVPAGSFVGETQYLAQQQPPTVRANADTEAVRVDRAALRRVLEAAPAQKREIGQAVARHLSGPWPEARQSRLAQFLLDAGLGEATNALLIDNALCIGCNNCESACAETHGGVSAFSREAGHRHGNLQLTNACRHCEHPYCMSECPTNSLHRAADGSVYVDDSCTGCGNCERSCPYDAIRLAAPPGQRRSLLTWLLFGRDGRDAHEDKARKHAVKCDLCRGADVPACVAACPTGAAIRVSPETYLPAQLKRG